MAKNEIRQQQMSILVKQEYSPGVSTKVDVTLLCCPVIFILYESDNDREPNEALTLKGHACVIPSAPTTALYEMI